MFFGIRINQIYKRFLALKKAKTGADIKCPGSIGSGILRVDHNGVPV